MTDRTPWRVHAALAFAGLPLGIVVAGVWQANRPPPEVMWISNASSEIQADWPRGDPFPLSELSLVPGGRRVTSFAASGTGSLGMYWVDGIYRAPLPFALALQRRTPARLSWRVQVSSTRTIVIDGVPWSEGYLR